MKILQINKFFYMKGGPERCLFNTSELLQRKGHEIAFFSMQHPANKSSVYDTFFTSPIDIEDRGLLNKCKFSLRMLYSREAYQKLLHLTHKFKPDIAHIHNFYHYLTPSIFFALAKQKIPIILTLHDFKLVCPSYSLLHNNKICESCNGKRFYNCVLSRCHKNSLSKSLLVTTESYLHHCLFNSYDLVNTFVSPSHFLIEQHHQMGFRPNKMVHLPNFIDISKMTPNYSTNTHEMVYSGRIVPEKGILTLIKAIQQLPVTLKICGEGPFKKVLMQEISPSSSSKVQFLDHLPDEELFNQVRNAGFLVLPSELYENNPFAILEAFALGKPVLGSCLGGIPELVKDGVTGMTFEPGNIENLKQKINFLIQNPEKCKEMGMNARKLIENEYNSELYYQRLMKIYKQALEGK